jgi:hypothetical protein
MTPPVFNADDIVWLITNNPPRRVRITKLGRKYVHVDRLVFHRIDGRAVGGSYRIQTLEAFHAEATRTAMYQQLRKFGVVVAWLHPHLAEIYDRLKDLFPPA